jgi:hypothetical protein
MYDKTPTPLLPSPPVVHHVDEDEVRIERKDGVLFIHVNGEQVHPVAQIPEAKDVVAPDLAPGIVFSPDAPVPTSADVLTVPQ